MTTMAEVSEIAVARPSGRKEPLVFALTAPAAASTTAALPVACSAFSSPRAPALAGSYETVSNGPSALASSTPACFRRKSAAASAPRSSRRCKAARPPSWAPAAASASSSCLASKPMSSTSSTRACGVSTSEGLYQTRAFSLMRSTSQRATPGILPRARSTALLQLEHVIPPTARMQHRSSLTVATNFAPNSRSPRIPSCAALCALFMTIFANEQV
mmetsp:Transcript_39020/g.111353  ORF Transcript_39020/g.111353 Transcript_39020/m.111353 type:complete len:216 (-) Transcript_39020:73-720(-)